MGVRLTIKLKGGQQPPQSVTLEEDNITLGRDQSCEVVLAQTAVSRSHARITRDGTLFFIEDLGSSFGTQLNNENLPKGEKRLLRNRDVIGIAQFDVSFERIADVAADVGPEKTAHMARKAVQHVMKGLTSSAENAFFRVMNGSAEGQRIEIADAQEYIFGRDSADADIVLKDDLVSRTHAKVRRDWSGTHVEDLDSRNGIRVNKKRVTQATLRDKDELAIGSVRLLFIDPAEIREESSSQLQRPDPGEGTESVRAEPEPPPPALAASPPEPSEPDAPEEPPEEAPEDDAYDASSDVGSDKAPDDDDESPQGLNVKNRQQMIALGIGAVMVVVGLVVLILLLIGA